MRYVAIVYAVIIGFLVFDEQPGIAQFLGASIVLPVFTLCDLNARQVKTRQTRSLFSTQVTIRAQLRVVNAHIRGQWGRESYAVLGLGNFGTAITRLWGDAGHHIQAWTATQEVFDSIHDKGTNEKYLPGVPLKATVTMDLSAAVSGADIVVLALPTAVVLELVDNLLPFLKNDQVILDLAKGLGPNDSLVSKSIREKLKDAGLTNPLCVLTGPTIATELAGGVFTTALVASSDEAAARRIVRELSTATFKLSPTDDPLGAEYWGAFKNVIALAWSFRRAERWRLWRRQLESCNLYRWLSRSGSAPTRLALHRRQPCQCCCR